MRKHLKISPISLQTLKLCIHITRAPLLATFFIKHSKLQIQFKSFARFGARTLNEIPTSLREKPKNLFKTKLHEALLDVLHQHDDYVDISQIGKAVKNLMDK